MKLLIQFEILINLFLIIINMGCTQNQSEDFNAIEKAIKRFKIQLESIKIPLPMIATPEDLISCYKDILFSNETLEEDADVKRKMPEFVEAYGYKVDAHNVTTKDGYILKVFRVRNESNFGPNSKIFLLNHGFLATSSHWFFQKGENNLGMTLADAGYDVWVNNNRGTSYSTGHLKYTQGDSKYWDFSWHEMGLYDMPALIDYILSKCNQPTLYYVGHSMGTTQFFVAMTEHERLNKKIETAFLLGPLAYMAHASSPLLQLAFLAYDGKYLTDAVLGEKIQGNFLSKYFNTSLGEICALTTMTCPICNNLAYLLFGYDAQQTDHPRVPVFLSKYPDSVSTKCLVHFAQSISHYPPSFRQFDYMTLKENEKRYGPGVTAPPVYDLRKVTAKIVVIYGKNDNTASPTDTLITFEQLGMEPENSRNKLIEVSWPLFNHMDFLNAKDAKTLVYNYILDELIE